MTTVIVQFILFSVFSLMADMKKNQTRKFLKTGWVDKDVCWTKNKLRGIWRRRLCCRQEGNAAAGVWGVRWQYTLRRETAAHSKHEEQHACPGRVFVSLQKQIFVGTRPYLPCPASPPTSWDQLHHCLSQGSVFPVPQARRASGLQPLTSPISCFQNIFRNLLLT